MKIYREPVHFKLFRLFEIYRYDQYLFSICKRGWWSVFIAKQKWGQDLRGFYIMRNILLFSMNVSPVDVAVLICQCSLVLIKEKKVSLPLTFIPQVLQAFSNDNNLHGWRQNREEKGSQWFAHYECADGQYANNPRSIFRWRTLAATPHKS